MDNYKKLIDIAIKNRENTGLNKITLIGAAVSDYENLEILIKSLEKEGFQSTFIRRFGINFFRILNSLLIGQKITDNTSGFRAYNRKALCFAEDHYP